MKISPVTLILGILGSAAFFAGGMLAGHQLTKEGKWDGFFSKRNRGGYSATTKFRVLMSSPLNAGAGTESSSSELRMMWLSTQVKSIASTGTLERVVKARKLATEWGISESAATEKLRGATEVTLTSGTDIVDLTVWDADPRNAAELANAVRDAYVMHRDD
jgi:capsular polysaccharide biosynthesis protein